MEVVAEIALLHAEGQRLTVGFAEQRRIGRILDGAVVAVVFAVTAVTVTAVVIAAGDRERRNEHDTQERWKARGPHHWLLPRCDLHSSRRRARSSQPRLSARCG